MQTKASLLLIKTFQERSQKKSKTTVLKLYSKFQWFLGGGDRGRDWSYVMWNVNKDIIDIVLLKQGH